LADITNYSTMANIKNTNIQELEYYKKLDKLFTKSEENAVSKLKNFSLYVPRQDLTRFLVRYEIFKKILNVTGSIIECGILHGQGLMTFAHLSSIFEPLNHQRRIIGFDTFEGFPADGTDKDNSEWAKKGYLKLNSHDIIKEAIRCYDLNRQLSNIEKIQTVKGDICETVPKYLQENPHLIISLLFIDCDLYEPTKVALETFFPRMPKGSIIAFDDINDSTWKGETSALLETIGIDKLKLQRFNFDTRISYAILE